MKPEISNYMREMQRRSAAARWSGLSAEEKRITSESQIENPFAALAF